MARKYVNPNRGAPALAPGSSRIRSRAEFEALMTRDPGPWTLVKTAELQDLLNRAEGSDPRDDVAMNWPELADVLHEGLR